MLACGDAHRRAVGDKPLALGALHTNNSAAATAISVAAWLAPGGYRSRCGSGSFPPSLRFARIPRRARVRLAAQRRQIAHDRGCYLSVESGSHGSPDRQSAIAPVHRSNRYARPGPATEICQCPATRIAKAIKMPAMTMEIGVDMGVSPAKALARPADARSTLHARFGLARLFSRCATPSGRAANDITLLGHASCRGRARVRRQRAVAKCRSLPNVRGARSRLLRGK